LTQQENVGKHTPGPIYFQTANPLKDKKGHEMKGKGEELYMKEDTIRYNIAPKFQFGTAAKLA